jgi:hypothetical protein
MSLLERQQKAQAALEARAIEPAPVPVVTTPGTPPGGFVPAARPGEQVPKAGSRNPAREELLQEIRVRLQREVIGAFDSLLEGGD